MADNDCFGEIKDDFKLQALFLQASYQYVAEVSAWGFNVS